MPKGATEKDIDLFDVLLRITNILDNNEYQYINLSLGPRLPVDDDDVHVWTATLEKYLSSGKTLCTVAVGNDGELSENLNRIQPPADLVNALSVGAANSTTEDWVRCPYSCVGPGRSPGFVKPDGLAYGGTVETPLQVFNLSTKKLSNVIGTSFSAPLVLRQALGLASSVKYNINPLTAKALLIHHVHNDKKELKQNEVGRGLFPHDLNQILYCEDDEVKLIYQGELSPSQYLRVKIPFPDTEIKGDILLTATFCVPSLVDPEHSLNYTKSGLSIVFRKNYTDQKSTYPFFNLKNTLQTERELREDAHKWETTLYRKRSFKKHTLKNPCFDVVYLAREGGMPTNTQKLENLPYVLIVSVQIKNMLELYDNIRQNYQTLSPIQLEQQITV